MSSDGQSMSEFPMHVSLAGPPPAGAQGAPHAQRSPHAQGSPHAPPEPSLPDSHPLNRLGPSNRQQDIEPDESLSQFTGLLAVVNELACTPNRIRAAECIAASFATVFPDASIRCAVGTNQIRRFYDSRLGWLGSQSSLRVDAESRWQTINRDELSITPPKSQERFEVVICVPEPNGDGRLIVWVDGQPQTSGVEKLRSIGTILPLLGNVFWHRPRFVMPQAVAQVGLHAKMWAAILMTACALIAIWPTQYPVACTVKVEPLSQRLVSAPFEATLQQTNVRPGDTVSAGDTLAILDGRPLRLELESIQSELHQTDKEHGVALATGRIADAQQLALKRKRLARRTDLIQDRLSRLTIQSPIDGVVVSGDLEKFVGATLELGQTMIEVAAMQEMAIEIEIPEYEIGFVQPDAMTRVRLGSVGGRSLRGPLNELYPAAEIREDRNVFVGRMLVDNTDKKLRPGMRGEATTYGPIRPFAWSWVRGGWERVLWWLGY